MCMITQVKLVREYIYIRYSAVQITTIVSIECSVQLKQYTMTVHSVNIDCLQHVKETDKSLSLRKTIKGPLYSF